MTMEETQKWLAKYDATLTVKRYRDSWKVTIRNFAGCVSRIEYSAEEALLSAIRGFEAL